MNTFAATIDSHTAVLNTPTLIALVALKGFQEQKNRKLYIEDLSNYLIELEQGGIDISEVSLSKSVGRYWSEDIAQFVSEGIVFGDIKHRSPLEFTEQCVEVCKGAIDEYSAEDKQIEPIVQKAKEILGLPEK